MGRGTALSPAEHTKIDVLEEEGYNPYEIARRLYRSRNTVVNAIRAKTNESKNGRIGKPRKISPKHVCAMIRKARTGLYTASDLRRIF